MKKRLLMVAAMILAVAAIYAGSVLAAEQFVLDSKGNLVTVLTAETFAEPPMNDWPWVRWNYPPDTADVAELERELEDMYEAGIAGVEIGQGGTPTFEQLAAILRKATELGMKVSIKYKDGAPVPGTYSADDDYVRKTLEARDIVVDAGATFSGTLPGSGTIIAVLAYRCTEPPGADSDFIELDRASVIDLTSTITGTNTDGFFNGTTAGEITWTAPAVPADAKWLLLTVRAASYSPQPEVYSREGMDQLIAGYESYWTPEIKELFKANNGGDIFVDSHDTDPWGAVCDMWSSNFVPEFKQRTGYDLIPNLAALLHPTLSRRMRGSSSFKTDHYYTFSDGSDERIRADFNQVRSDLFVENRIIPFTEWAHQYNLTLRLQCEDGVVGYTEVHNFPEQIQVTNALDRPEHETLAIQDGIDSYRPMASANHMNGNTWYSNELAAASGMNYLQTFQDLMVRMSKFLAGGGTKPVYHVYPYYVSPTAVWPGHDHFGPTGFSNAWGPRNPNWYNDAKALNTWMARNEQVLKQGTAKVDIAVYMHNYAYHTPQNGQLGHWNDPALQEAGYTWDYLSPTLLNLPNAKVTNGRLAEDGPAYKALVFNSYLWPDANSAKGDLTVEMAQKFLEFAKSGLPIVFVGELPTETPYYTPEEDATLRALISELVAQGSVRRVDLEADVPSALAALGVKPAAEPNAPSTLFSVRRYDAATETDYYFLYNQGCQPNNYKSLFEEPDTCHYTSTQNPFVGEGDAVDRIVTFEGKGVPYLLDATSGTITPIAEYTSDGERITMRVQLARDESMLIAISDKPGRFGIDAAPVHVTGTSADKAVQTVDGKVAIRASAIGTYVTTLSNGESVRTTIDSVPARIDLTNAKWQLSAEDWLPAYPFGTTGVAGALTSRRQVKLELDGPVPWPDIPELANASGVGTYKTVVELPADWDASYGAYLELGQVVDSFTLTVNGFDVPVNQLSAKADIGPYLRAGANVIVVRVSTTLNNRLAALQDRVASRGVAQEYGLAGPVVLTPYRQAVVWE